MELVYFAACCIKRPYYAALTPRNKMSKHSACGCQRVSECPCRPLWELEIFTAIKPIVQSLKVFFAEPLVLTLMGFHHVLKCSSFSHIYWNMHSPHFSEHSSLHFQTRVSLFTKRNIPSVLISRSGRRPSSHFSSKSMKKMLFHYSYLNLWCLWIYLFHAF